MNQKSLVAILGVVVIILISTTVYFMAINKASQPVLPEQEVAQKSASTPIVQPVDETASWRTYSNFGYTFKYPEQKIKFELSDNNVQDQEVNNILKVDNESYRAFHFSPIDKNKVGPLDEKYLGDFVVNKNIPTGRFVYNSLDEYIKKNAPGFGISSNIKSRNGNILWQCGLSTTPLGGKYKDCFVQINGGVYQMRFQLYSENYFTEKDFNNMVESFQITN